MNKLKIAFLQYNIAWQNKEKNKKYIESVLNKNRKKFDLLVLPEMSLTGFCMDVEKTLLNEDDIMFFKNLAKVKKINIIFGGVLERQNKLICINEDGNVALDYSKIHLFSYAKEDEHYITKQNQNHFIKIKNVNINLAICYDLRFSYMFWNDAVKTDLILVCANWPKTRREHWITLLKARAIENQTFVLGVNRVGKDPKNVYSGDSCLINPFGKTILNAKSKSDLFITEINLKEKETIREKYPFLKDRRV